VDILILWEIIELISNRVAALVLEGVPIKSFPDTNASDLSVSWSRIFGWRVRAGKKLKEAFSSSLTKC
jgi:hypothetical protein